MLLHVGRIYALGMHQGHPCSPAAAAALVALAGMGLVLPLLVAGLEGPGATAVDLVGRSIALVAVVLLAMRRPGREPHLPIAATGDKAPGRTEFDDALRLELARLQRFARPFALVSIHCEGATTIRERDGSREAADLILRAAETIAGNLRRTDFSASIDPETFGVLLPETDASTAGIVVDQLRERLMQTMRERHWPGSFSIGVAVFTRPVDSLDTALARVEELMARVRRRGRNGMLIETDGVRQRDAQLEPA
jgi:diguanylate cyclase (GGDEF)-like protein